VDTPDLYGAREPLGKAFTGSLLTHGLVVGLVFLSGWFNLKDNWGSPHASSGSVGVNMVKTIPIPRQPGPTNPLANDTKSIAPEEPAPVKPKPQVKAPEPDAIPIPDKLAKPKKVSPQPQSSTLFRPQQYQSNQVYSKTPQAANSPLYGMKGAGGIDIGPASELGDRFGWYTTLMSDRISQHWDRADVRANPSQRCAVSFTIARNGTVSNVQVAQASGSYLLDTSARRAVLDSNPLPALPREFEKNQVAVEVWFQLKQ
jgi:periplasmic protein TonB